MKRVFITAVLVAAAFLTLSCSKKSEKDLLAQIQEKKEIVIATEGSWAPWTYHDEANQLVGFDVEAGKLIAEKLGVKAKFVEVDWDGIFAGLDAERYDISCNGIEITDERSLKYDFSDPYAYTHTALIVRADNTDIKSYQDLKGKTTTNSIGSTYEALAKKYGAEVITIDSFSETLELVEHGRAQATLNDNATFYYYNKVQPDNKFKVAAMTEDASRIAIPMRKTEKTESLRLAINKAIQELKESGELARIAEKYFGTDITK
ncbi:MAG: transporter substrate-binding domain-containing protein [Treponemataceae bacterium]|nr:transporter substrate-binding domain-containing protein [Treponemataceae bacterium]